MANGAENAAKAREAAAAKRAAKKAALAAEEQKAVEQKDKEQEISEEEVKQVIVEEQPASVEEKIEIVSEPVIDENVREVVPVSKKVKNIEPKITEPKIGERYLVNLPGGKVEVRIKTKNGFRILAKCSPEKAQKYIQKFKK